MVPQAMYQCQRAKWNPVYKVIVMPSVITNTWHVASRWERGRSRETWALNFGGEEEVWLGRGPYSRAIAMHDNQPSQLVKNSFLRRMHPKFCSLPCVYWGVPFAKVPNSFVQTFFIFIFIFLKSMYVILICVDKNVKIKVFIKVF